MLQHWTAKVDLQVIIDTDQCIRYMAKYATKGELKSQSASEILSVCVNTLNDTFNDTDMASSALRRAMIQVVGERDIGSQKNCTPAPWKTIGKPFFYILISLCVTGWKLQGSHRTR